MDTRVLAVMISHTSQTFMSHPPVFRVPADLVEELGGRVVVAGVGGFPFSVRAVTVLNPGATHDGSDRWWVRTTGGRGRTPPVVRTARFIRLRRMSRRVLGGVTG